MPESENELEMINITDDLFEIGTIDAADRLLLRV
jgi:hypothetical protein